MATKRYPGVRPTVGIVKKVMELADLDQNCSLRFWGTLIVEEGNLRIFSFFLGGLDDVHDLAPREFATRSASHCVISWLSQAVVRSESKTRLGKILSASSL
jgi:hypothetical protein